MNLKKTKQFTSLKDDLFIPLDKSKMSKIYGGLSDPTSKIDPCTITNHNGDVRPDDGEDPYSD